MYTSYTHDVNLRTYTVLEKDQHKCGFMCTPITLEIIMCMVQPK